MCSWLFVVKAWDLVRTKQNKKDILLVMAALQNTSLILKYVGLGWAIVGDCRPVDNVTVRHKDFLTAYVYHCV